MAPDDTLDDRYQLLERIGEGGAGRVHRGVDRTTGKVVAVKVLREKSLRSIERFAREARVLAELGHPHIVRYVAHGVTGTGEPYLAMEWLEGESLAVRLERGALGIEESLDLAVRVADALAAAHAQGVVHRDVKPSNLFLVGGAIAGVRVLDFGMVLALHGAEAMSLTGGVLGTPGYVAPEQASGDRARVDARADVFSLGAVLFECLTGRRAFPGEHLVAVLAQLLVAEPPRVRELRPEVPMAVDALVARLLAKEPGERPANGAAVLAALEALGPAGGGVLHSRPPPAAAMEMEAITGEEQRMLAVIAVNLGASITSPEELEKVRDVADREAARVDLLGSGAILVTLTSAVSATDQASRAARTALGLRAALSGAVVAMAMGRGEAGGRLLVGPVGDRAVELLARGEAGGPVRLDETAQALLDQRFETRHENESENEKSGVRAGFALVGERGVAGGARLLLGRPSLYVGRERELKMLRDLILETLAGDRGAQAAVVTAAAGMGKTRLRHELVNALQRAHPDLFVGTGRAEAMSAGSAFVVVASVLRNAMSIGPDTPVATVRAIVRKRIAPFVPAEDQRRVAAFLGEMMGAPFPEDDLAELRGARHNAARMAGELVRAFVDFALGVTATRPVLMVLEDLHWGDAASIRLVDQALRDMEGRRFVVLGLARPEVHELFPHLWSRRGAQNIRLGALPRRAAEELVTSALDAPLASADVARICDQAGGNPFYLEELIRAFAAGHGAELPETVLGMVTARLEALPAAPRILLRAASVFGQEVPGAGAVALLAESERDEARRRWLPWLVQQEILVRQPGPAEDLYAFRHALLREGSYAMLTSRDRILGHRLAAAWMESAGLDGRDEARAAVVGEHFFRGQLWAQAFACFDRAGDAANRLRANGEARRHYGRALGALEHVADGDDARRRRVDTILKQVDVSYNYDSGSSLELLAVAESLAAALPGVAAPGDDYRRLALVHYWMGRCHYFRNAYAEALGYCQRVLVAAEALGDLDLAALPSGTVGRVLLAQGYAGRALPFLDTSLGSLERRELWGEWVLNAGFVGIALGLLGSTGEAVAQGGRVLARALELRSPSSESSALNMLGTIHVLSGDPVRGRALIGAAVEAADHGGDPVYAFVAHGFGAWTDARLGRHEAAAEGMERARAIMTEAGRRLIFADWFEAFAIEGAALAGRTEEALAAAPAAVASFRALGSVFAEALAHRGWGLALAGGAHVEEALVHLETGRRLLDVSEAHVEAARTRLYIAFVHRQRGDVATAVRELEAAAYVLEAAGALAEVAAARASLLG